VCFAMWVMCLVLRWMRESGICGAALGRARSWLWGMRWLRLLGRWMGEREREVFRRGLKCVQRDVL